MARNTDNQAGISKRFLELDVLRGVAALGVVLFHYTSQYNTLYGHSDGVWFYFGLGRHGVELFFIMSGFVILITLERTKSCFDFIVKRFSRLYPAYWVAILLTFTVTSIAHLPGLQVGLTDALTNLTMFQWLFDVPNVDKVYWTLKIEICFYIIMLLIYQFKLLKRIETVVLGWLALVLFYSIKTYIARWGSLVIEPIDDTDGWFLSQILSGSHLMLIGIGNPFSPLIEGAKNLIRELLIIKYAHLFIAGLMLYKGKQEGFSPYRLGVIILCILAQKFAYPWETSWSTTLIVAGFIMVMYLAIKGYLKWISLKPLVFLGTISYSLYLTHQNIGYAAIRQLYQYGFNPNVSLIIATLLALGIASVITFSIELPANRSIRLKYKNYQTKHLPS